MSKSKPFAPSREPTSRMCVAKPRDSSAPMVYRIAMNAAARRDLMAIRQLYLAIVGRPISTSVLHRRAYALLLKHLEAVQVAGAGDAEKAELLNHIA
jgi:hypothetical protein